jgi:hypothetical protein
MVDGLLEASADHPRRPRRAADPATDGPPVAVGGRRRRGTRPAGRSDSTVTPARRWSA